jgi:cytochrome c biogenesis protein CcmG, thiol:disulfide interchange protein DsbE
MIACLVLVAAACSNSGSSTGDLPDLNDVPGLENASTDGETAADFSVATLDGAGFTLSEHLADDGRPVFLNMWASWCPPCKAEMPDISAASEAHDEVKFIGISVNDEPSAAADFATTTGIRYTIGFDEDGAVAEAYQVRGLPATYIISSEGIILERVFGAVTAADIEEKLATWFS